MSVITYLTRFQPLPFALIAASILATAACSSDDSTEPPQAVAGAAPSPEALARETCRDAWLATLETPGAVDRDMTESWPVEVQPDGTLHVRITADIRDALDEKIEALWNCVVLPDGVGMRLVSLVVVDI
ncbi:hypothetical protein ACKVEX_03945 [Rhodocyclaceae bacterium SMB388]